MYQHIGARPTLSVTHIWSQVTRINPLVPLCPVVVKIQVIMPHVSEVHLTIVLQTYTLLSIIIITMSID